ncbi:N-acetyltransferase [Pseudomonas sp. TH43]|uniref:N-acetyltransferase n=1 Tax=Pseudomonas sp. TH43 TaxID=2796407 RepID=UPI00191204D9|nr:N-acetyltransferase [Pseudomonas sp. TH43]MBK5376209.1 N-acetyltransferase [Pseudomonas sp. TH43]
MTDLMNKHSGDLQVAGEQRLSAAQFQRSTEQEPMEEFEPIRDFFQRRQAKHLSERASTVQIVTERAAAYRGHFVFPGIDTFAGIEVDGQRVGYVDYGINPLGDRLYINKIEIEDQHQRGGVGLSVMWLLWRTHQVPLVPIQEFWSSKGFWYKARQRLAAAGALIDPELHTGDLEQAQQRWQHLIPELPHERQIREMMASPEWPEIEAGFNARQAL